MTTLAAAFVQGLLISTSPRTSHHTRTASVCLAATATDTLLDELDTVSPGPLTPHIVQHPIVPQVPVFGILVVEDGKLYGGAGLEDSGVQPAMVYTQLADAQRVLGKLCEAYPGVELSLQPLSLGAVLRQTGARAHVAPPQTVGE